MNREKPRKQAELFLRSKVVKGIILTASVCLSLPAFFFSDDYLCLNQQSILITGCIDPSWKTAVNLAFAKSFVFGTDFVFTYGPLGFFSTRTGIDVSPLYLLLFDIFVAANIAFILLHVWRSFYGAGVVLLGMLVCYLSPLNDVSFKLLLIMLFWMLLALETGSARYFIVPLLIAVLSFFIKLNTAFLAIFLFYLFLVTASFLHRKLDLWRLTLAILLPVILYVSSHLLNLDIPGYIANGYELVKGYGDSMNFIVWTKYSSVIVALALFSLGGFVVVVYRRKLDARTLVSLFSLTLVLFLAFKQSLVRSDTWHLSAFLFCAPIVWMYCVYFLCPHSKPLNIFIFIVAALTLLLCIGPLRYVARPADFNPVYKLNYFSALIRGDSSAERRAVAKKNFALPEDVRHIIGGMSLDIIPWNVNLIYFNDLRYNPRPVVQSYAAYTRALIDLNRQKYLGPHAPEFVILSADSMDLRYGFFDDAGAKIAILKNYSVRCRFKVDEVDYLLLIKEPRPREIVLGDSRTDIINLNQNYEIPDVNKTYYAKITIKYSALGDICRMLYQPLQLRMIVNLSDGTEREFRPVPSILESGVILNPYVETTRDYELFFDERAVELRKIKSLRFEPLYKGTLRSLNELNYTEPIVLEMREMTLLSE